VAEKLRTLLQRLRPTDLADLALILRDHSGQLDRAHVSELAVAKFTLVKQGDRQGRIESNVEAMRASYNETAPGLAPDAPSFAEARGLVLAALTTLLP
jgi:predicted nucleotidyltransferase component of viral defense system